MVDMQQGDAAPAPIMSTWPAPALTRATVGLLGDLTAWVSDRTGCQVALSAWARRRDVCRPLMPEDPLRTVLDADGPLRGALGTGEAMVVPDLRGEERWGPWRRQVLTQGFAGAAALTCLLRFGQWTVLALYVGDQEALTEPVLTRTQAYTDQIASLTDLHSMIPSDYPVGTVRRTP